MIKFKTEEHTGSKERKTEYIVPNERIPPANQVLPIKFREIYQPIQDLKIYDDDVWLVTFPKSGTQWMHKTLCGLLHGLDLDKLESLDCKRPTTVEHGCFSFSENIPQHNLETLSKFHETMERPRIMRTHLLWKNLPKVLRDPNCKAKIVYVARHPKDVCVSYFYHFQMLHGENIHETHKSFEVFANEFLNDRLAYCPYWTHIFDFWARRHHPKILFLTYEEMKTNFPKVLDNLQNFFNLDPLTADQKRKLTEYLSFEKMKDSPATNYSKRSPEVFSKTYGNNGEEANFMRKQQVDRWESEMSTELSSRFDTWILENSAMIGYEDLESELFCKL